MAVQGLTVIAHELTTSLGLAGRDCSASCYLNTTCKRWKEDQGSQFWE